MALNKIRKDVDTIRKHTQTPLKEPDWMKRSREIKKLLDQQARLMAQLSEEEIREAVKEVVKDYAESKQKWQ